MMSNRQSATFVKLANGRFLIKNQNGKTELTNPKTGEISRYDAYTTMSGTLTSITEKTGEYGTQYLLHFQSQAGEYILALQKDNMTTQSIINSLASIEKFGDIALDVVQKNDRTQVYVKNNGVQAPWAVSWEEQPKATPVLDEDKQPVLGKDNKPMFSTKKRVAFFEILVAKIQERIGQSNRHEDADFLSTLSESDAEQAAIASVDKATAEVGF